MSVGCARIVAGNRHTCCNNCTCHCEDCNKKVIAPMAVSFTKKTSASLLDKLGTYMLQVNNDIEKQCGFDGQLMSGLTIDVISEMSAEPALEPRTFRDTYAYLDQKYMDDICHIIASVKLE